MKFTITLSLLLISFTAFNQYVFNAAENGLLVRQKPDRLSQRIGKLQFGEKVQIIERTKRKISIRDNGNTIEARWYKISSMKDSSLSGYVFSGYLTSEHISTKRVLKLNDYKLTISNSSQEAFQNKHSANHCSNNLDKAKCLEQGLINVISEKEVELTLTDQTKINLKKDNPHEQFIGYTFLHFDPERKLFFFWENWYEAGHPIMVDASTGKITEVVGSEYSINPDESIAALYGEDIGAGWTPNGIQLFSLQKNIEPLFTFDPTQLLDEAWGPIEVVWENNSTLLIECLMHNADSGYVTIYKKLTFEKD
jgi:hypothetical protein